MISLILIMVLEKKCQFVVMFWFWKLLARAEFRLNQPRGSKHVALSMNSARPAATIIIHFLQISFILPFFPILKPHDAKFTTPKQMKRQKHAFNNTPTIQIRYPPCPHQNGIYQNQKTLLYTSCYHLENFLDIHWEPAEWDFEYDRLPGGSSSWDFASNSCY
jgi:hypothetical protein